MGYNPLSRRTDRPTGATHAAPSAVKKYPPPLPGVSTRRRPRSGRRVHIEKLPWPVEEEGLEAGADAGAQGDDNTEAESTSKPVVDIAPYRRPRRGRWFALAAAAALVVILATGALGDDAPPVVVLSPPPPPTALAVSAAPPEPAAEEATAEERPAASPSEIGLPETPPEPEPVDDLALGEPSEDDPIFGDDPGGEGEDSLTDEQLEAIADELMASELAETEPSDALGAPSAVVVEPLPIQPALDDSALTPEELAIARAEEALLLEGLVDDAPVGEEAEVASPSTDVAATDDTPAPEDAASDDGPSNPQTAEGWFREGERLDTRAPTHALFAYRKAARMGYVAAYRQVGRVAAQLGYERDAVAAYRRYLDLRPGAADAQKIQTEIAGLEGR